MSWSDFTQMLADAANSPAVFLICALLVFVAGAAFGVIAMRTVADEPSPYDTSDAGDTHAHIDFPPATRQRVRAGSPPPLPYSYDGGAHARPGQPDPDRPYL